MRKFLTALMSLGWLAGSALADTTLIPRIVAEGAVAIPAASDYVPAGAMPGIEAGDLDFAKGAVVDIKEAHEKRLARLLPAPPTEERWNNTHLPHVRMERWRSRTDHPDDPLYSPVSPAVWRLREMAAIHTAPSTHLAPVSIRPPFLYLPVRCNDLADAGSIAYDSPHFRVFFPKSRIAVNPVVYQKIMERLEDVLVLMRMMPIHFAKAHLRDVPSKITIKLEFDPLNREVSVHPYHIDSIKIEGDIVSVKILRDDPLRYEAASICGLINYLLHPMLVHPVIRIGFQEMLIRTSPLHEEARPRRRTTDEDRRAERDARDFSRWMQRSNIPNLVPPVQRIYSFTPTIESVKLRTHQMSRGNMSIKRTLEMITPHEECSSCTIHVEFGCPTFRNDAVVIATYFLFGDNGGDPIHLQNYFNSLQLLGVNQKAQARLFYGRDPALLESEIRRWASR